MKNTIHIVLSILLFINPMASFAAPKFSAICNLKGEHYYHLANEPGKKTKMIEEWAIKKNSSISVTLDYSGGKEIDVLDSRNSNPVKATIIFDNGNTLFAVYLGKGSAGGTTRTYAVNFEANAVVSTTLKSGSFFGATLQAEANGNPECKINRKK